MKNIDINSLNEIVRSYKHKKVMLTFHSIGDTDSIASAFALMECLEDASIATPDFITSNSRRIIEKLGFSESLIKKEFKKDAEVVVLLDVNNFEDCGSFRKELDNFKGAILVVDHHNPSKMSKENVIVFNDESYNSAASIVYELIKSLGVKMEKRLAKLLAAGIISDSAELRNAFPKTFMQIGELLEKGDIDYQSLLLDMQHIASTAARSEFVNDLFKANVMVNSGLLIIYGFARIHANKLADDAIKIGADLSIFYTINGNEVSFSARLRPPLDKTCRIHLGKIMKELAHTINGRGGGHPCAAGAYGPDSSKADSFIGMLISEITGKAQNQ